MPKGYGTDDSSGSAERARSPLHRKSKAERKKDKKARKRAELSLDGAMEPPAAKQIQNRPKLDRQKAATKEVFVVCENLAQGVRRIKQEMPDSALAADIESLTGMDTDIFPPPSPCHPMLKTPR